MTDHTPTDPPTPERGVSEAREALDVRLGDISNRVNRGIGEGMLGATRWRDALIEVGTMLDDLINDELAAAETHTPTAAMTRGLAGSGDVGALREALERFVKWTEAALEGTPPDWMELGDIFNDAALPALAAVRAETLAGSEVVERIRADVDNIKRPGWPLRDSTPPTPALTAARLVEVERLATESLTRWPHHDDRPSTLPGATRCGACGYVDYDLTGRHSPGCLARAILAALATPEEAPR